MISQNQDKERDRFWSAARAASPTLPGQYIVRRIGGDTETTTTILDLIRSGNKTGTVSVPEVLRRSGEPASSIGDGILLLDAQDQPALAVKVVAIDEVAYRDITDAHTALDGPRIRELGIWKAVHGPYFEMLLAPFGVEFNDDTAISFERFELLYP